MGLSSDKTSKQSVPSLLLCQLSTCTNTSSSLSFNSSLRASPYEKSQLPTERACKKRTRQRKVRQPQHQLETFLKQQLPEGRLSTTRNLSAKTVVSGHSFERVLSEGLLVPFTKGSGFIEKLRLSAEPASAPQLHQQKSVKKLKRKPRHTIDSAASCRRKLKAACA